LNLITKKKRKAKSYRFESSLGKKDSCYLIQSRAFAFLTPLVPEAPADFQTKNKGAGVGPALFF